VIGRTFIYYWPQSTFEGKFSTSEWCHYCIDDVIIQWFSNRVLRSFMVRNRIVFRSYICAFFALQA